ncbi:MAG: hypothetical protein M1415_07850 [Firmicutes bacterium]|nr:hypothetical protein [Bacillota bacterium]
MIKRRGHRWALVSLAVMLLGLLSGCWDQRPVETRAAILAIGVDPGPRPGLIRVTFVFPNVTLTAGSLTSVPSSQETFTMTVTASTLAAALSAVQREQSRAIYLGQVRVVALSTRLASRIWTTSLHDLTQMGTMVLSFWVVAASNAYKLVTLHPPTEMVPEVALYRALSCKCQDLRWPGRAWSVWTNAVTPGVTPAVADVSANAATNTFTLNSLAVWARNGVSTWSREATIGWAYLTGRSLAESVSIRTPSGNIANIGHIHGTAHLQFSGTVRHVQLVDIIRLQGTVLGGGAEMGSGRRDPALTEDVSRTIRQACDAATQAAIDGHTDPFGWHRDLIWRRGDAFSPAQAGTISWKGWRVVVRLSFQIRNEGVLR